MSMLGYLGRVSVICAVVALTACSGGRDTADETSSTSVATLDPTTSTSMADPPLNLSDSRWVTHGLDGIRTDDGTLIWETRPFPAAIVRDRGGGLVFTDSTGLWWFRAGESEPERVGDHADEVIAVSMVDDEPVAITWAEVSNALRLRDASPVDPPANGPVEVLSEPPWLRWTAANGLSAWITEPEVEVDFEGQPSRVIEPAHLVISDGAVALVDLSIGTIDRAWARIHDFDGRRLIVSRGPHEPAMPEESFVLVDLATGEVEEILVAGGTKATFTAADSDWTGPVRVPELSGSDRWRRWG